MRELKFRVWEKFLKKFINITAFEIAKGRIDGLFYDSDYIGYYKEDISINQYTGLKDKNGKEIYEDDIVLYGNEKYLIKIDDYKFYAEGFYAPHQDDPCDIFSECAYKSCEVIGNIYKNPKLLEK